MRTRRRKLTATQLTSQNQSEEVTDKDSHARDAMKYVVMSLPEPTEKNRKTRLRKSWTPMGRPGFSLNIYRIRMEREDRQRQEQPVYLGRRRGIIIRR